MRQELYFDETSTAYTVINQIMRDIVEYKRGYFESVFENSDFEQSDDDVQNTILGILMSELAISTKDFILICLSEKMDK